MAGQPPLLPPDPPGGGPPDGGAAFPGPPGSPVPPRGSGGAGSAGWWAGGAGGAAAGPPPSGGFGPGEGGRRVRRGAAAALAAGFAAVAVVAAFVWVALDEGPPYSDLAACAKLLPPDAVAQIPGLEGAVVDGSEMDQGETYNSDVVEQVECWTGSDDRSTGLLAISMRRYSPRTEQRDYAALQRELDRERPELSGGLAMGASGRQVEAFYGSVVADVRVSPLDAGDHGFTVSYTNAAAQDVLRLFGDMDGWAVAQYHDRNLIVQIIYEGTAAMSDEERVEAVGDLARLVQERAAETARTVEG